MNNIARVDQLQSIYLLDVLHLLQLRLRQDPLVSLLLPSRLLIPDTLLTSGLHSCLTSGLHSCLNSGLHGELYSLFEVISVPAALTAQSVPQVSPVSLLSRPAASTVEVAPCLALRSAPTSTRETRPPRSHNFNLFSEK